MRSGERASIFDRRGFLGAAVTIAMGAVGFAFGHSKRAAAKVRMALRPPGALPEAEFLDKCARCFKCGNACPNSCIRFHGVDAGLEMAFTPYIKPRDRGCILCGECAKVCPTGALEPFAADRDGWLADVDMGTARLNKSMCFSYNDRTCGACYQACPLAGEAIRIGVFEKPLLDPEKCVGCGLCEQACLHLPQAIRVVPRARLMERVS
jgi:ferredoxin-type protein NapG